MHFKLNDAQQMLQDSARRFVEKAYAFEARTALIQAVQTGGTRHWQTFAENGWLAAALPETCGGLGGSVIDTALIAQELGRGLVLEPYLGSGVLATQTLMAAATPNQREALLPPLAEGARRYALAYSEADARGMPEIVSTSAEAGPDGYTLRGTKTLVLGGVDADAFIVSARLADSGEPSAITLFLVDTGTPGLTCHALPLHDGTWAAELEIDGARVPPSAMLGEPGEGLRALRHGLAHATAALCAELVGGMEKAVEVTADYLKVRKQFGVPIGSFQALQHRMSDMAAEMELARSMLFSLLAAIDHEDEATLLHRVSQAKAFVGRAARYVCGQAIQLHGGIGMTDEYVIGHYYKRAIVADLIFGSADRHEAICAEAVQAAMA